MSEFEDLTEQFKINPGEITFPDVHLDFQMGVTEFELKEKKKIIIEIYEPRNDNSTSIF
jgi:hypothetical protein